MNAQSTLYRFFATTILISLLLSACSPAQFKESISGPFEKPKSTEEVLPWLPPPDSGGQVEEVVPDLSQGEPWHPTEAAESYEQQPVLPYVTKYPYQPPEYQSPQPPRDNYFQNYGVNPYEDPREDHLSTFALDVDTASYTVARRYVMDGNLPPADAVRVEEFVNYFDGGYPRPEDNPFAIYADGALSPFEGDSTVIMRVGVQGYEIREKQRKPASLTFVIDVSGSMAMESRLELVKRSLQLLVERLRQEDSVSIVVYGSEARIILFPTSGADHGQILEAIYSLQPEGATNAEAGLQLGYQMAYEMYRQGSINRVILCSDGVANVGNTGPEQILESIRGYAEAGITLTTVGFGMGNFNDVLMEQLADNGDGHYAYVDNLDEAHRLFVEDLTSTLQVIARDAKVQVDFNPEIVNRYRLIGYENRAVADQDFRNDYADAGELGAGHSATALYALVLYPGAHGRIATVQLRWQDPDSLHVQEINSNFNTWDVSQRFGQTDPHFQLAVVAAQYAELLRFSPWAEGTSIGQLIDYVARISRELPGDSDISELVHLLERASRIQAIKDW
ncbi:MAG: hypothetical protein A2Z16_01405 [Chloroflexi bacterium RBG_16_54_18]|nr:MAG: hypothetical protein A2Z16_01405 [Chloroflexi bacterium RBG_16_54_18]